jgi:hypothetical protein
MRSGTAGTGGRPGFYLDPKKVTAASGEGGWSGSAGFEPMSSGRGEAGPGMGSGAGSSGADASIKVPGATTTQDKREITIKEKKESLAHMARKMNMEESIKLKWDKKRYNQIERKKMREQIMMQTASQALLKVLEKALDALVDAVKGGGGGGGGGGGSGMGDAASGMDKDLANMMKTAQGAQDENGRQTLKNTRQKQYFEAQGWQG